MDVSTQLLSIGLCLLASAFASGAETALTTISEARTRQLIEEDGHRILRLWLEQPARVLATLLLLNTIVNALAAALMTELVGRLGAPNTVAIATGLTTLLLLSLGEITPKTLARQYATTLAPLAMPVILLPYYVFHPVVTTLGAIPVAIEKLFRESGNDEPRPSITSEEIEYMIDLGVREGVLDEERSELLTSVLEFADTVTREIMVPRTHVVALPLAASPEEVFEVVHESEHSRIPVYGESIDEIVGVLHVRSLLADMRSGKIESDFDIRRYLHEPFFVPELMKISRLLREFQRRKLHLAIVVDEFGGTAGVVALEDVVEEIVGEIQDELDVEEGRVRQLPDGSWLADGAITLRDLEDHLGVEFPDELDFDSVGGFVVATAGKVPPVGTVVTWEGLRFTVRQGDERHVSRVEITRLPTVADDSAEPADTASSLSAAPSSEPAEAAAVEATDGARVASLRNSGDASSSGVSPSLTVAPIVLEDSPGNDSAPPSGAADKSSPLLKTTPSLGGVPNEIRRRNEIAKKADGVLPQSMEGSVSSLKAAKAAADETHRDSSPVLSRQRSIERNDVQG